MGAPYVLNVFKTNWAWTSQIPPREHPICATDSNESPKKWWNTNLNQEENKENSTKASLTTSRKEICDGFPCFYLDPWLVFHVGWKGLNKTCRRHRGPPPTPGRTPLRSPCWWWVSLQANPYPPLSRKITVEKNVARWMDGGWFLKNQGPMFLEVFLGRLVEVGVLIIFLLYCQFIVILVCFCGRLDWDRERLFCFPPSAEDDYLSTSSQQVASHVGFFSENWQWKLSRDITFVTILFSKNTYFFIYSP